MRVYQKIIFVFLLFLGHTDLFASNNIRSSASTIKSDLGKLFLRTITRSGQDCEYLTPADQNMHMYSRWLKGLHNKKASTSNEPLHLIHDAASPHAQFHKELSKKVTSKISQSHDGFFFKGDKKEENDREKDFFSGHSMLLEGKTQYPKVFVSFYAQEELEEYSREGRKKAINWLCPIEQAFLFHNIKQYRQNLAIMKAWGLYDRFLLVVIPENTYIKCRFGLAAPQAFPSFDKKTLLHEKLDGNDIKRSTRILKDLSKLNVTKENVYEYALGGGVQMQVILVGSPPQILFTDLKNPIGIAFDQNSKSIWAHKKDNAWDSSHATKSHFNDPTYDESMFEIHKSLENVGIIDKEESEDFDQIIKKFVPLSLSEEDMTI